MEKSFYIDANVFIFAYANDEEIGSECRKIIDLIANGKIYAFTSVLTFDEFFYQIKKLKGKEKALIAASLFLNLNNLSFIEVNLNIINQSLFLLKEYDLDPRDAIHLACALHKEINNFISNDNDFDKIKEIKRFDISHFK